MKLHESLAQNHSIRLQAEAETWQEAVKIGVDLLVAADVGWVVASTAAMVIRMSTGSLSSWLKISGFFSVTSAKPVFLTPSSGRPPTWWSRATTRQSSTASRSTAPIL